jgi:hypothetical protein
MLLDTYKSIVLAALQDPDFQRKNSMFCTSTSMLADLLARTRELTGQVMFVENWATALVADGTATINRVAGRIEVAAGLAASSVEFAPRVWEVPPRFFGVLPEPLAAGGVSLTDLTVEYHLLPPPPPPLPVPYPPPPPPPSPIWTAIDWYCHDSTRAIPVAPYGIEFRVVILPQVAPLLFVPPLVFIGEQA